MGLPFRGDHVYSRICSGADPLLGLELTPEGLRRGKEVVPDTSITHPTAKRLDLFTIGSIVVALAFILADRLWLSPPHTEQSAASAKVVTDVAQTSVPEST